VPDSDRNRSWLGKLRNRLGVAGYPAMRIVALAETGTRGLLGAVIGGTGERAGVPLARKLVPLLGAGMLLLAGRAYDAADLLTAIAATGAHFLVRGSASRKPGAGEILPDGSYLSQVDGLQVRIIEADRIASRTAAALARPTSGTPVDLGTRRDGRLDRCDRYHDDTARWAVTCVHRLRCTRWPARRLLPRCTDKPT
jgi:hypothetical protein